MATEDVTRLPPAEAMERIAELARGLDTANDPARLTALARSMPARLAGVAPEVGLALAELAQALVAHQPRIPEDVARLPPRVAIAWRRVQIAGDEGADDADDAIDGLDDRALLQIVTGWSFDEVVRPRGVLLRMARAEDPRLRAEVLPRIAPLVAGLALTGPDAFACLELLAGDVEPALRGEAIAQLARPWLLGLSPGMLHRRRLAIARGLRGGEPGVALAAVAAAAALGERASLAELLDARDVQGVRPATIAAAIRALGAIAANDDLDRVLALADDDPLAYAGAARTFLLAAHRHGVFVRDRQIPAVLRCFDAHPGWTGEELARVGYIARHALIAELTAVDADDPRWRRRAAILSHVPGASDLLAALLARVTDLDVAATLLDAAGRSPDFDDEPLLLRWLPILPIAALPAVRVKGGAASIAPLRALIEDPFAADRVREPAIAALWALVSDRPAVMHALAAALGPDDSGALLARYRMRRDPEPGRLLAAPPWPERHRVASERQFAIFVASGDVARRADVVRLFRALYRGHVRRALDGDPDAKRIDPWLGGDTKRNDLWGLDQDLCAYGQHLVDDGRPVRRWVADAPEAGGDLVLAVVRDWLAEAPSEPIQIALLETAASHQPDAVTLRQIEPLWRRGEPSVRRAALEALIAAGDGARGLELSLGKLAEDERDPRVVEHALAAVRTLRAGWAEPIARAALARPEMSVKKEAAATLVELATPASIPALVDWLGRHDNTGFRASLVSALKTAAGEAYVAVLVDALERASEPRAIALWSQALSCKLSIAAVRRLARSAHPAHVALVDACLDGTVVVCGQTVAQVARALHRDRLRVSPPVPGLAQIRRIQAEGFSPEAARAVVAAYDDQTREETQAAIGGPMLVEWIAWLRASADPDLADALVMVLEAAGHSPLIASSDTGQRARGALLALLDGQLSALAAHPRGLIALLVYLRDWRDDTIAPADRQRAIALVRRTLPSWQIPGLERYRLLRQLGAVITLEDLAACLQAARLGPDVARDSFELLREALAIPDVTPGEPAAITTLRDAARDWYRTTDLAASRATNAPALTDAAWLAAALAERPLGLPVAPPLPSTKKPPFAPLGAADLATLLDRLAGTDAAERRRAAGRLLDWPDAAPHWHRVRDAYLASELDLDDDASLRKLASTLSPSEPWPAAPRAEKLVGFLSDAQLHAWLPGWLDEWAAGNEAIRGRIRPLWHTGVDPVAREVVARARAGDFRFTRLLGIDDNVHRGLTAIAEQLSDPRARAAALATVDALRPRPPAAEPDDRQDPVDPVRGMSFEGLIITAHARDELELAVRAIRELTRHGEPSIEPLTQLAVDRRARIRSAALRALRVVATRDHTLATALQALAIETRRDVELSLIASLGHGRHAPALPALLDRLIDADPRIRAAAHDALLVWGRDVLPAVHDASRKARPDRRPRYDALIDALG